METLKKSIFKILFIIFITTIVVNAQSNNPNFATDGIIEFFKIVDILKADRTPTKDDWKNFYASSGYKQLIEIEFGEDFFKEILTAAFKPSEIKNESAIIEKHKKKSDFYAWYIPMILTEFKDAETYRAEMMDFVSYIASPEALLEAEKRIAHYIPNAKIEPSFKINFIIFGDSRGYDPIVIGISNPGKYTKEEIDCLKKKGYDSKLPSTLLIAHEAFHNIRNKMLAFDRPKRGSEDFSLVDTMNRIEDEGIADLISARILYSSAGCFPAAAAAKRIGSEQKAQYAIVNAMNYYLTEIAKNLELTAELGKAISGMTPRSGHPTGYYMANMIYSQFGQDELKRISTNPFQFFISYNNAAKKVSAAPLFSNEAIDLIKKLEGKYLKLKNN